MIPTMLPPEMLPVVVIAFAPAAMIPIMLPPEMLPVTDRDDSVPTEVMFGWALVVTVPAVVALTAVPLTLLTN